MTEPRRVRAARNGPVLVAGPVRIETPDGIVESDRFMVAICACGRSRSYPLCDTSHRRRDSAHRAESPSPGQELPDSSTSS